VTAAILIALVLVLSVLTNGQVLPESNAPGTMKVIIDTDVGDDIDDAYALALALSSPELKLLGVTTAWGNTELRARLVDRFLCEVGKASIPVAVGVPTQSRASFTQARWAEARAANKGAKLLAVDFLLDQIRRQPGEITLIAIAPLTNVGAAIDRDPETFRKLKRVVMMGGSIRRGYEDIGYAAPRGPDAEYNIASDIASARKLLASGVPIFMMPLDATVQLKLDEVKRHLIFRQSTPLTDALALLNEQWGSGTPTLYDVLAVAYAFRPNLCQGERMRLAVDEHGYTRVEPGAANVTACTDADADTFFRFFMPRILEQHLSGTCPISVGTQ
jgi:inosine-uridine nucleoside N-ribohydrolase